ncbi:MAG: proton-conducting transporter membrane subunit, partial [Candidatus Wallbacteria bacterium]|nr:proton-conducting transporter membrane subunit [Candidatus Wallbacteria bacterium]
LPFQTWLPDAGVAPSPVTALLHAAVLVKIGVYVFARLFIVTLILSAFWQSAILFIVGLSALISAGAAMIETDMKRIIAYSTISQIGFIFLGLAAGNELAIAGGLLYILMHGLAKAGLFLCAGIVEHSAKTKDITKMGGLFQQMPITAFSFLFCSLSVMGIPPFGGFWSKYMVLTGAAQEHIYVSLMFLFGAVMTIIYLFRIFRLIFLGESKLEHPHHEGTSIMVFCVALLAVLSLAGGILVNYPGWLVQSAVIQMLVIAK